MNKSLTKWVNIMAFLCTKTVRYVSVLENVRKLNRCKDPNNYIDRIQMQEGLAFIFLSFANR